MFAVGAALDVGVGIVVHELAHIAGDGDEVGHNAIVHKCMSAEYKRVVVHRRDRRGGGSSDVGEADFCGRVGAYASEVQVVEGGLGVLVEGGSFAFGFREIVADGRVPG